VGTYLAGTDGKVHMAQYWPRMQFGSELRRRPTGRHCIGMLYGASDPS
jgi:hypothetical protein